MLGVGGTRYRVMESCLDESWSSNGSLLFWQGLCVSGTRLLLARMAKMVSDIRVSV